MRRPGAPHHHSCVNFFRYTWCPLLRSSSSMRSTCDTLLAEVALIINEITTLACRSRQFGGFGMPMSPCRRLGHAKVPKLALECQSRHFGDLGMPRSPFRRLGHAKVPKLVTLACKSRHFGNLGMPKSPFGDLGMPKWPKRCLWHAKVANVATLARQSRQSGDLGMPKWPKWKVVKPHRDT